MNVNHNYQKLKEKYLTRLTIITPDAINPVIIFFLCPFELNKKTLFYYNKNIKALFFHVINLKIENFSVFNIYISITYDTSFVLP